MRLDISEVFAIMKTDVYNAISNLFLSKENLAPILIGGLEIHLVRDYAPVPLLELKRHDAMYQKVCLSQQAWKKISDHAEAIKILHSHLKESAQYVHVYLKQFVEESCDFLKLKNWTYDDLIKSKHFHINQIMKQAFEETSNYVTDFNSQQRYYSQACIIPLLREEIKVTHFSFCKELVIHTMEYAEYPYGRLMSS